MFASVESALASRSPDRTFARRKRSQLHPKRKSRLVVGYKSHGSQSSRPRSFLPSSIIHPPPHSHTIAPPHNNNHNPPPSSLDINFDRPVDVQRVQRHLWYRYLGFTRNRCAPSCLWASTFSGCDAKPTPHPSTSPPRYQLHDGFLQQTIYCLGRSTKIIQGEHDHHLEVVAQGSTKF